MERDARAPVATFFTDAGLAAGKSVPLSDAAAHHARVKRLAAGDRVRLVTGDGRSAMGAIAGITKRSVEIAVESVETSARPPAIHLRVPIGDKERMLWVAEKATELGAASWQAVRFRRSMSVTPRGEGPGFAEKVRARMISALEQSGGAWLPEMLPDAAPADVAVPVGAMRLLLDAGGESIGTLAAPGETVILFGPEGGLEPDERSALIAAGWRPARLAATTLRFETAGIAALAVVSAAHLSTES